MEAGFLDIEQLESRVLLNASTAVFTETMGVTAVKPWTGATGADHAWTVTGASLELNTSANYLSGTAGCGLLYKGKVTANGLAESMAATAGGIAAAGDSGYVEFYVKTQTLDGTDGWTFQVDSGGGYVTRLSELTGSSHAWTKYHYDLAPGDLVDGLGLRFQFAGGGPGDTDDRISVDQVVVTVTTGGASFDGSIVLGCPTDASVTINAYSADQDRDVYFAYGTSPGALAARTAVVSMTAGEPLVTTLSSLTPDTAYYYTMVSKPAGAGDWQYSATPEYSFHTQRAPGETFVFCAQGDSHPERVNSQFNSDLYARTLQAAAADNPDFYLCMGDDFSVDQLDYATVTRQQVEQRYQIQRPYLGLIGATAPLFLVNGNHEQAARYLLDGTADNVAVWAQNARNLYYSEPAPDGFYTGNEEIVPFIDGGKLRDYFAWTWGDALFVTIDPYWTSPTCVDNPFDGGPKRTDLWDVQHGDAQYQWLKATLEQSTARYKFVFAHHVLGTGRGGIDEAGGYEWGGDNADGTWGFDARRPGWSLPIHQLMAANGVTAFIQGHDHVFVDQQLDGVHYITLPEPADPNYALYNASAFQTGVQALAPNTGYARFTVAPEGVKVEYVRTFLPADETSSRSSGMVAASFTLGADADTPVITASLPTPREPTNYDSVWVTASIAGTHGIAGVSLAYAAGTAAGSTPMYDDGLHADGAAGDGVYGGRIPPQAAGAWVRYAITALDTLAHQTSRSMSYSVTQAATPPFDVMLGRPTDTGAGMSVMSLDGQAFTFFVAHGTTPGLLTAQTAAYAVAAGGAATLDLSGLPTDAACYYRLYWQGPGDAGFQGGPENSFHTQRPAGATFTFDVQADFHYGDPDSNSLDVYAATAANMLADRPDFLVDLGDTFMTEKYVSDPTTASAMDAVARGVRQEAFDRFGGSVPLLMATGNHDSELGWMLDPAAPTDNRAVWSTQARETYFPAPTPGGFYSGSGSVDPYVQELRNSYYAFTWGDAQMIVLDPFWYTDPKPTPSDGPWGWTLGKQQYDWLTQTLADSTARFRFVFIHHLVGGGDTNQARGGLEVADLAEWGGHNTDGSWGFEAHRPGWAMPIQDLLLHYGVSVVFHGHDHLFVKQDLDADSDGQTDLVYLECPQPASPIYNSTGTAAGFGYVNYASDADGRSGLQGSSGHIRVTVSGSGATIEYVRAYALADRTTQRVNGAVAYSFSVPARQFGDANRDGLVDLQDFGLLKENFGAAAGATWGMGDFNADGAVDLQDFGLLKDNFGHSLSSAAALLPVGAIPPASDPGTPDDDFAREVDPACLVLTPSLRVS